MYRLGRESIDFWDTFKRPTAMCGGIVVKAKKQIYILLLQSTINFI